MTGVKPTTMNKYGLDFIDKKYSWLRNETGPRILWEAMRLFGITETAGPNSTPAIMQWAKEIGTKAMGAEYTDDAMAWCGLFLAVCAKRAGLELPPVPLRALQWVAFGLPIQKENAALGDVLVFTRKGGGHVGLYIGEDDEAYHVLGGNQSDKVSITRVSKERLTAVRRSIWKYNQPPSVRKIKLSASGELSVNEL